MFIKLGGLISISLSLYSEYVTFIYLESSLSQYTLLSMRPNWWNTSVKITKENYKRVYGMLKNMIVTMKFIVILLFGYIMRSAWTRIVFCVKKI
mgnify:CR=1 FL=1